MTTQKDLNFFGKISKEFITCYHFTDSLKTAEKIYNEGFNMKMFGSTGKKHGIKNLYQYDPVSVFSLEYSGIPNKKGDVVEINLKQANVLRYDWNQFPNIKKELFEFLNCKNAKDFSKKLKVLNIDVIGDLKKEEELIIINTDKIKINSFGLDVNPGKKKTTQKFNNDFNTNTEFSF